MKKINIIHIGFVLLAFYNVAYWLGKFMNQFPVFYTAILKHWKLITFLEFLVVASLAVDTVAAYDRFSKTERNTRFAFMVLLGIGFMARFIFGAMELYLRGDVN
ncbi:MAG: hypothetical protein ACKO66_00515 [Flavobacteriales bacterium]